MAGGSSGDVRVPQVYPPQQPTDAPRDDAPGVLSEARAFSGPLHDSLAFPFLAGRIELSVRLTARPLFDLRRRTRIGVHVSRALSRASPPSGPFGGARPRLEPADIHRLDTTTLHQAVRVLRPGEPGAVVVPACWSTVASSRGRFSLLYAGLDHEPDVTRLMIEITGLTPSAEPDEMANVASHIEAQQRGVLVRVAAEPRAVARLSQSGMKGLSLDLSPLDLTEAASRETARQLMRTARLMASNLLVLGLPAELAEDAAHSGATHAVMEERFTVTV